MNFWDEDAVDRHIAESNHEALAGELLKLTRWVVSKEVRSPRTVDREELVQVGLMFCLKAARSQMPRKPRFRYFAQVVKNEARRYVAKACKVAPVLLPDQDPEATVAEVVESIIRSEAGRTFPAIRDALVFELRMGRIESRAAVAHIIETAGRPGTGKAMALMLKEELG